MKNPALGRRRLWIILPFLLLVGCSTGTDLNFDEATQRVIDEVIKPDGLETDLIALAWPELLQPGDVVAPDNFFGEDPAPGGTKIEADTWFFWIDDLPGARFAHSNRFVFVDRATGSIQSIDQEWWPELNGEGLWLDDADYLDPDNWIYSTIEFSDEASARIKPANSLLVLTAYHAPQAQTEDSPGYALVINASNSNERGNEDMQADGRNMVGILKDAGFRTTYLGPEDDPNPDRSGVPFIESDKATKQPWREKLTELSGAVKPGESLVVYITGHGGYTNGTSAIGGEYGFIFDFNLKSFLQKFNPGVHIIVITDACESGGFVDALQDVADVTMTSTSKTRSSFGDIDFGYAILNPTLSDLNPFDEGGEYTSSLVEGWKNLLSDPTEVARIEQLAKDKGLGFWPVFASEAYKDASIYDLGARLLLSSPQMAFGSEKTKAKIVTADATGDVQSCSPAGSAPEASPADQDVTGLSAEWSEKDNQHVLHFEAEFSGVETIDQVMGGIQFLDLSRPQFEGGSDSIYDGMGNLDYGFSAGSTGSTSTFNYVGQDGLWQSGSNPGYSVDVDGNLVLIDVPSYLIPPAGAYFFYTDDGSNCDSVGLDSTGPVGLIPQGGPFVPFDFTADPESPTIAAFNDFSGDAVFCEDDFIVEDPGVDIQGVEIAYDPTLPGGWINFDVLTGDPGPAEQDTFSFYTLLKLTHGLSTQQSFFYEFHDGIEKTGELDQATGDEIETEARFDIHVDERLGTAGTAVSFQLPLLNMPSPVDGVRVFTYRLPGERESTFCDDVIMFITPAIVHDFDE